MRYALSGICLWLVMILLAPNAQAQDVYVGEAQVSGRDDASRAAGIGEALKQVFVKVSANPSAADHPGLAGTLANASGLMQFYDYRQELGRDESGKATATTYLRVRFFPQNVDQALMRAGFPVWGRERPKVLIMIEEAGAWLDESALSALARRASERGIVVRFPSMAGLDEAQSAALANRDLEAIRNGQGGGVVALGRWLDGAIELRDGRNSERVSLPQSRDDSELEALADRLIQALLRQQLAGSSLEPESFDALIAGLSGAGDYARAIRELGKLSSVKKVQLIGADDQGLRVRLTVLGGADRLLQGVTNTGSFDMPSTEPAVLQLR